MGVCASNPEAVDCGGRNSGGCYGYAAPTYSYGGYSGGCGGYVQPACTTCG